MSDISLNNGQVGLFLDSIYVMRIRRICAIDRSRSASDRSVGCTTIDRSRCVIGRCSRGRSSHRSRSTIDRPIVQRDICDRQCCAFGLPRISGSLFR